MKSSKKYRSKAKTLPSYQLPFEDSLILIVLNKCEKIIHELQRSIPFFKIVNIKMAKNTFSTLDHDVELMTKNHQDYGRVLSLILNIKSI